MTGINATTNHHFRLAPAGQWGFTLVETMVALFLFIVLMTITGNIFLTGLNNQRRAFAVQSMLENINLTLESVTNEVRVADIIYTSDTACPGGASTELSFHHPQYGDIQYALQAGNLVKTIQGASDRLNSATVKFANLGFCVTGNASGDGKQVRITAFGIVVSTQSNQEALQIPFQTTISPRLLRD